jgi:hypothetical protein
MLDFENLAAIRGIIFDYIGTINFPQTQAARGVLLILRRSNQTLF